MKQPKKLTRNQKEIVLKINLKPQDWMMVVEDKQSIVFVNKISGKQIIHTKGM